MIEKKGHGKGGRLRVEGMQTAHLKGGSRWRTRRTKGGAPFSAALREKGITQKVLAVNVYLVCIRTDLEIIERMWFAGSEMQKPAP